MKAGNVQPDMVDSVVVGNVLSAASSDCPYVARHTALRSGLRMETPANTVNRLCGSGFQVRYTRSGGHYLLDLGNKNKCLSHNNDVFNNFLVYCQRHSRNCSR